MIVSFALVNSSSNHRGCGCTITLQAVYQWLHIIAPHQNSLCEGFSALPKQYELISNLVDDLC